MADKVYEGMSLANYADHKRTDGKDEQLFAKLDDLLESGAPKLHAGLKVDKTVSVKPTVKIVRAVKNPILGTNK